MAKSRRVIKDAQKSVSVSREQVEVVAKKLKENRPAGLKIKYEILKSAPTLHPNK